MKTKVALVVLVLFVISIVAFGRGHERHQKHEIRFHKSELRSDNNKQNDPRDYKFDGHHRNFNEKEFASKDFNKKGNCKFSHKKFDQNNKEMNHKRFNHKKFDHNKESFKHHNSENKDLSYIMSHSILLDEVIVYGKKV